MKKLLIILLCVTMGLSVIGCASSTKAPATPATPAAPVAENKDSFMGVSTAAKRFKVGTTTAPTGHYVKGLQEFQSLLEEYSNGQMTIDIYPNSQLGNERDMMENVSLGVQDMTLISTGPIANFVPDFSVLDLPYIFETEKDAYEVLDGEVGTELLGQLSKQSIIGLGFWENGFRHITNDKKEILVPADLQSMKLRTMENNIHMAGYKALGAVPTPMAWGEIFTALAQGTVGGQENPLAIIESAKVYEVQKYVSLTGAFYSPCVLMINDGVFNGLSKEEQEIFTKAANEAKVWQRDYSSKYNAEAIAMMEAKGIVVSEVDVAVWKEAVSSVYDNLDALKVNKALVEKISK